LAQALIVFFASAAAVIAAGSFLSRSADSIAEATGIGRVWIGAVLLATATSLPELATDVSAVRMQAPNLAIGDLFGSSLANMLILALIDLLPPRRQVLRRAAMENALAACLAIVLNALAAACVLMRPRRALLGVGPESLLLVAVYIAGTRAVYRNGLRAAEPAEPASAAARAKADARRSLRRALAVFAISAAGILAAAPPLAWSAKRIAVRTGLSTSFVGTWMLGLATSLPELVTSVTAVRMEAFDLAVANLFGSNAFNMVIFFALDLASPHGPIFAHADPVNALAGFLAVILMSVGLASIVYRAERRFAMLEPGSALMLVAYLAAIFVMYVQSSGG
jgi:cation:H+ antiporter